MLKVCQVVLHHFQLKCDSYKFRTAYLLFRHGGTKLWEATATARTIGMPNNKGWRRQPPPGEVGGAKFLSHFH